MTPAPRNGQGNNTAPAAAVRFIIESGEYVAVGRRKRSRQAEEEEVVGTEGTEEQDTRSGRTQGGRTRKTGPGRAREPPPPPMLPPPHLTVPTDTREPALPMEEEVGEVAEESRVLEIEGRELPPPPPPPATTPPPMTTQEESQWQADNMTTEAHRLATEAAQMTAAAVLMRKVSVEFARHQSGQESTVAAREESLEAEVPMEEENEGETQTALEMMELEIQGNAASTVNGIEGSGKTGEGGKRRKRNRPQADSHKKKGTHGGRRKHERGKYDRDGDEEGE